MTESSNFVRRALIAGPSISVIGHSITIGGRSVHRQDLDQETVEAVDRLVAARVTAKAQQAEQQAAAKQVKMEEWVREHGSERLRKALALGLLDASRGAYYSERLALELPGYIWDGKPEFEESEIRNPSLAALEALETARKVDEEAILVKVRVPVLYAMVEPWHEAIRRDIAWANDKIAYMILSS